MSTICDDLRAAVLQALIPDPDKCPEEKRGHLVKLSDLPLTYMRGNGLRKNDIIENGSKKCVLYGELFTKHTEGVIEEDNLSSTNVISNVISKSGDILIPGTSTASKEVMLRVRELYIDGVQIGGDINIIRSNANLFYPKYMSYVFDTFSSKRQLFEFITGTTGIIHISNSGIKNLVFYLPSIEEQKRIVEKIDELMTRVADLEQSADALASLKKAFPDDIKASLLQAAMQGKLTKQLPEDGSAEDLLEEIKAEKEKLITEGKIKKQKPLAPITDDEIPFSIPDNWEWVRLGDITYNHGQKKPEKLFSYIDVGTLNNIDHKLNDEEQIVEPEKASSRARKIVHKGDVIYATIRPYLHNICIIDRDFSEEPIASTAFAVMSPYTGINNKYLFQALLSPDFDNYANRTDLSKGVAYPAISEKDFFNGIIPLPPLAEQKRIVERLDTLMQNINVVEDLIASE